jgi:PBP1b-binding outer membrane lipoprotein LpoB
MKRYLIPLVLPLLFTGCAALTSSAPESWVRADRATFNAVSSEYISYVDADTTLDQDAKDRRHRTVETWRVRLDEHEKSLAQKPAQ